MAKYVEEGRALKNLLDERARAATGRPLNVAAFGRALGKGTTLIYKWFEGANRPTDDSQRDIIEAATAMGLDLTIEELAAVYHIKPPPQRPTLAEAIKAQADAVSELVAVVRPLVEHFADDQEILSRQVAALEASLRRPDGAGSRGRSVPHETAE
jgi:hypothetical protein